MKLDLKMLYSFKLKSHPNKLLIDHLRGVANRSKGIIESKFVEYKELYSKIAYLIGVSHDIGKGTSFFQKLLNDDEKSTCSHHGFLSSLFGYFLIKKYLKEENIDDEKFKFLPLKAWIVVLRHHGNIDNVINELNNIGPQNRGENKEVDAALEQIKDMNENHIEELEKICLELQPNFRCFDLREAFLEFIKSDLNKILDAIYSLKHDFIDSDDTLINGVDALDKYFSTLLFYSVLLDADKLDASNTNIVDRWDIPNDIVDRYKMEKFKGQIKEIDKIREEAYQKVVSNIRIDNKILSLNLPTGAGKTLTGLSFAIKLRKDVQNKLGFTPRIIYSLPFLSIIDQSSDVFAEILADTQGIEWKDLFTMDKERRMEILNNEIPSSLLLKHHHLADIKYKEKIENEIEVLDINISLLLSEGWHSEIVITTFVQFFHSLITNKNRSARKFHNIVNSIIVLDEVQAIPYKYWALINRALKYLAEKFNCWIVIMTATEPFIFNKGEIVSLIEEKSKKRYFETLDRLYYRFDIDKKDFEEFKKDIFEEINSTDKDIMVVLNTIESCKSLYLYLRERFRTLQGISKENENIDADGIFQFPDFELITLSTHIIPYHRIGRISRIKNDKKRKVIITTQLVEAGVDISVDIVYRDISPLDCIVQTAGRCNRNNEGEKGIVKVVVLKDRNQNREFWKMVYDPVLVDATQEIIQEFGPLVTEKEFNMAAVNNYYKRMVVRGKKEKETLNSLIKLNFGEIMENFRLIEEEKRETFSIFLEVDENAKKLREKIEKILKDKKGFEKRDELLMLRKELNNYTISIRANEEIEDKIMLLPKIGDSDILYIPLDKKSDWYKPDIGFNPSPDASFNSRAL